MKPHTHEVEVGSGISKERELVKRTWYVGDSVSVYVCETIGEREYFYYD